MESTLTTKVLDSLLPQLGVSVVFLFVTWRIYTDSEKKIREKDEYIKMLTAALQDLYIKNTEILTQLKDTMSANIRSTEANTEALRTLERTTRG